MTRSTFRRLGSALLLVGVCSLAWFGCREAPGERSGETVTSSLAETVTVYRDDYGIPHIYADTAEAGLWASGYAMAEDRLQQMLENYLFGMGEYSAHFGPGENDRYLRSDLESRMWDHYGKAKQHYKEKLNAELRSHLTAFVKGINDFIAEHPERLPEWWPSDRPVDVYMPVAFSRQFIWGWPAGQAARDLRAVGLEPSFDVDLRASNQIALSADRTTFGAPALIIDPHLSWFGRQRYWELRLHAGDIHIAGFATAGFPYVNLGHNENVAWAHTTGGPDTADVYELKLDPKNKRRYLYDGEYRELAAQDVAVQLKGEPEPRSYTFLYSHYGPIIAEQDTPEGPRAYAAALAYAEEIGYLESKYWFMIARDYRGAMKALDVRQIMPQNVMVADTSGNTYYQRTGRVPIRPEGYDWDAPVDGSTSATEWQGIHEASELMSLLNPESGAMQNCNVGPDTMLVDSPLQYELYPEYIYNQPKHYTHQRGASALAQLAKTERFNRDALRQLALDRSVYQADRWQAELKRALAVAGTNPSKAALTAAKRIAAWNRQADAGSNGALHYYYWRDALLEQAGQERVSNMTARVNDYLELIRDGGPDGEGRLEDADLPLLVAALERGAQTMQNHHGDLDAVFGDVFRVGRTDIEDPARPGAPLSFPVGGGSLGDRGMATLRAIGFDPPRADHTRWGNRGQTSTQVVLLTKPIRSFSQPPLGQSDLPSSPHFVDQARDLLSKAKMKPAWFARSELRDGHVSETRELVYEP